MLKKTTIFLFLLFLFQPIFSLDFSVEPYSGVEFSYLEETLFEPRSQENVVSILEWNQAPGEFIGLKLNFDFTKFSFSLDNSFSLPLYCGTMYDKDFNKDLWFNYSINENTTKFKYDFSLFADYNLYSSKNLCVNPSIGVMFSYYKMSANNGYGWYGKITVDGKTTYVSWDNENAQIKEKGSLSGVDLTRLYLCYYLGINTYFIFNDKINVSLTAMISPYAYTTITDLHRDDFEESRGYSKARTEFYFTDDFFKDFLISLQLNYLFNNHHSINLNTIFYYDFTNITDTYIKGYFNEFSKSDEYVNLGQDSKNNFFSMKVTFNYCYKF